MAFGQCDTRKTQPPIPVAGKTENRQNRNPNNGIYITASSWLNLTQIPAISSSEQLFRPSNKITAAKRATYIIYNYHTDRLWPLLQPQAAVPVTEITPQ